MTPTLTPLLLNPTGGAVRGVDKFGSGAYGASRGERVHRGVDMVGVDGGWVLCPVNAHVVRRSRPYGDDGAGDDGIMLTTTDGWIVRLFYVRSVTVEPGAWFSQGKMLGRLLSLQGRYKGITDHCHLDLRDPDGEFVEPQFMDAG